MEWNNNYRIRYKQEKEKGKQTIKEQDFSLVIGIQQAIIKLDLMISDSFSPITISKHQSVYNEKCFKNIRKELVIQDNLV